jgi:hypothetical protein
LRFFCSVFGFIEQKRNSLSESFVQTGRSLIRASVTLANTAFGNSAKEEGDFRRHERGLADDTAIFSGSLKASGTYFDMGLGEFLIHIAAISLVLALFNMLPFPGLDGGVMAVLALHHFFPATFTFERSRKVLIGGLSMLLMWCLYLIGADLAFYSANLF